MGRRKSRIPGRCTLPANRLIINSMIWTVFSAAGVFVLLVLLVVFKTSVLTSGV